MTVLFEHRSKISNKLVLPLTELKTQAVFLRGIYETTDKEIVKALLAHPFAKRNKYKLKSDATLVNNWLENDEEPSYLTKKEIDSFSVVLINDLADLLDLSHKGKPALLRAELLNTPVTTEVQELIDKHKEKKETVKKTSSRSTVKKLEELKSEE